MKGGGVVDEQLERKEKEELFSKGMKIIRRIKPRRNSFALKDTGAQDLAHYSEGQAPALWDVNEKKHNMTHSQDIPTGYVIEFLMGSTLFHV